METTISETLSILPRKPGVYLMKDRDGIIIYVGKAKILRNRVRSYFSGRKDSKTGFLVSHIAAIDFMVTNSEYEALILENNLIKQHKPKYNINLKDGKTYPVIRITNEDYPRVFRTRRIIEDGSSYYGPFSDVGAIDRYLDNIEQYFPLRKCRGPLKAREQPCLYYHIHRCSAPCAGKISKDDYKVQVDSIKSLLEGDTEGLSTRLRTRMHTASDELKFEEAARLRDAIRSLQTITEGQQVEDFDPDSRDYIAWAEREDRMSIVVFQMRGGKLRGSETFRTHSFAASDDPSGESGEAQDEGPGVMEQFIPQYYGPDHPTPQRIYIGGKADLGQIQKFVAEELGSAAKLDFPESSREQAIVNMARENARQDLSKWQVETGDVHALKDLQAVLELPVLPMRIEGFDIAQLHGKHTVAAMVSFWKGIPDKVKYRIFQIRSLKGAIDDFESIREAVARRYTRVLNEELERPDLILIDGGKGQLNAAQGILASLGLGDIAICSLAKEEEEIFLPGRSESVRLPVGSPALRILQAVRDESHRFGTGHNQRLRSGDIKLSTLESISGIGPGRAKKLIEAFGGLDEIAASDVAAIRGALKINAALAERVLETLRSTRGGKAEEISEDFEEDDFEETPSN